MAALTGVRTSIGAGGVHCLAAGGPPASALPKLRAYDERTDEHAPRMRERRSAGPDDRAADTARDDPDAGPAPA
jgi:hypothetical protein